MAECFSLIHVLVRTRDGQHAEPISAEHRWRKLSDRLELEEMCRLSFNLNSGTLETIRPRAYPSRYSTKTTLDYAGRSRERSDVRERRLAKFRQNVARFRLYRHRFLQENMRFAAIFKIYQIVKLQFLKFGKSLQILRHMQNFC